MSNMVVQTNVLALNGHRNMKNVGVLQKQASTRLASGFRINNAADDAAGLAISEKMRAQIRGLDMASKNAQDGQALIMTAEGGLQEITNVLQRMRELSVQAATGSITSADRQLIQKEIVELSSEITALSQRVEYNKMTLLNGQFQGGGVTGTGVTGNGFTGTSTSITFHVGPNTGASHQMHITIGSMSANSLGVFATGNVLGGSGASISVLGATGAEARKAIDAIQSAIESVAIQRAQLGAYQNRMEYTYRSLDISSENLSDSESRIRNTDMAKEMMNFTKSNVLQQAAVSMLAQANQLPQNILQLLR